MKVPAPAKKDWTLTSRAFDLLLLAFGADRDLGAQKYEITRRKLVAFFEARGSDSPLDHADEAINRVARRIEEGEEIDDLNSYFYGVARLLWMETLRAREKQPVALDLVNTPAIAAEDADREESRLTQERRLECFEDCLGKLPAANRGLVIEYYREEKGLKIEHRKRQAESLGMSLNALRLRACRIRAELAACISSCLERSD